MLRKKSKPTPTSTPAPKPPAPFMSTGTPATEFKAAGPSSVTSSASSSAEKPVDLVKKQLFNSPEASDSKFEDVEFFPEAGSVISASGGDGDLDAQLFAASPKEVVVALASLSDISASILEREATSEISDENLVKKAVGDTVERQDTSDEDLFKKAVGVAVEEQDISDEDLLKKKIGVVVEEQDISDRKGEKVYIDKAHYDYITDLHNLVAVYPSVVSNAQILFNLTLPSFPSEYAMGTHAALSLTNMAIDPNSISKEVARFALYGAGHLSHTLIPGSNTTETIEDFSGFIKICGTKVGIQAGIGVGIGSLFGPISALISGSTMSMSATAQCLMEHEVDSAEKATFVKTIGYTAAGLSAVVSYLSPTSSLIAKFVAISSSTTMAISFSTVVYNIVPLNIVEIVNEASTAIVENIYDPVVTTPIKKAIDFYNAYNANQKVTYSLNGNEFSLEISSVDQKSFMVGDQSFVEDADFIGMVKDKCALIEEQGCADASTVFFPVDLMGYCCNFS